MQRNKAHRCEGPLYTERALLSCPSNDALTGALSQSLAQDFLNVDVSIVNCPDLTEWGLASAGLGGRRCLVDVGGVPNLLDPDFHSLSFSLNDISKCIKMHKTASFLGAGAVDALHLGYNAELMPTENMFTSSRQSVFAKVNTLNGKCELHEYNWHRVGFLCNLFVSEGSPGPVIRIEARHRKLEGRNFVSSMRLGLADAFSGASIGMGGTFKLIESGVKAHIMPDFKKGKMTDGPEINEWLQFYEFNSGATMMSTFITSDPTHGYLNLRLEHTHFFNRNEGEGGHFYNDTTPSNAHYIGYFVPAESLYRIENAFDRSRCVTTLSKD